MAHIIHLITSLEGGGTENFLHQMLMNSPQDLTHEVIYLKRDGPMGGRIRQLGISVQRISNPIALFFYLNRKKPDILHTLLFRAHQLGRLLGKLAGIPHIVSSQRAIDTWQKPWHRWMDQWTLQFCDGVCANSASAAQLIQNRLGKRSTLKLDIIPNGIDSARFTGSLRPLARKSWNLPESAILAGTLMRLHPEKGADFIPEFAQILLERHVNLHIVIAGVGPLESDLKRITSGRLWSNRIHWLGWMTDTPSYLSALDMFWLLSREESFPQTLLEASVMGLPWIAPDVGGIKELPIQSNAVLYSAGQPQKMVEAAEHVLGSLREYQMNASRASDTIRRNYDISETARRFYAFLRYNRSTF